MLHWDKTVWTFRLKQATNTILHTQSTNLRQILSKSCRFFPHIKREHLSKWLYPASKKLGPIPILCCSNEVLWDIKLLMFLVMDMVYIE